jgi:hypothetical protein
MAVSLATFRNSFLSGLLQRFTSLQATARQAQTSTRLPGMIGSALWQGSGPPGPPNAVLRKVLDVVAVGLHGAGRRSSGSGQWL